MALFAAEFYRDSSLQALLEGNCPDGFDAEDRNVARQLKALSRAAPIAVRMACELIDTAADTDLEGGLQGELDRLPEIFSTADALEGLSALIEGRRATYSGK